MYTLYYTARSYTSESTSMIPHIALEEIGAPYEIVEVELEPSPPDWYLQLNPHGKIPTLIDRGGAEVDDTVVYPSAAILFYLADRHARVRHGGDAAGLSHVGCLSGAILHRFGPRTDDQGQGGRVDRHLLGTD